MSKEPLFSFAEIRAIAQHMVRTGIPMLGDAAPRSLGPAACPHHRSWPNPGQRAAVVLDWFDGGIDDQRFHVVDRLFEIAAARWFDIALADAKARGETGFSAVFAPPEEAAAATANLAHRRLWALLAAACSLAGSGSAGEQFHRAVSRLCPGLPTDPNAAPTLWFHAARHAARQALTASRCVLPLPREDLSGTVAQASKAYFTELSGVYTESREWTGEAFVRDLELWTRAVNEKAPEAWATAMLACIGADRRFGWNSMSHEFFAAAHLWVVRQLASLPSHHAELEPELTPILLRALREWAQGELAVRALASLCREGCAAITPVARDAAVIARCEQRALDAMEDASDYRRNLGLTADAPRLVLPRREAPDGHALLFFTPSQLRALDPIMRMPDAAQLLRALHLLQRVHAQLILLPPRTKHAAAQDYFHEPVRDLLRESLPDWPTCGYRWHDAPRLAEGMSHVWLAGGDTVTHAVAMELHSCLNPSSLARPVLRHEFDRQLPQLQAAGVEAWAGLVLDVLTDPIWAAVGRRFGTRRYNYLEGALRSTGRDPRFRRRAEQDHTRLTHQRLFREFARGNLQYRTRATLKALGVSPAAGACAICRSEGPT